ncbi:hypothetical protein OQX61_00170 [Pedobacter sp. PLR]|uniref:hypothetical protein n=1 Tax=Pedobacter sp. PLR TaxID=2994465 RepID=UPI00224554FF|nr:hypothetical protein [Pedobacter sp. PLR]MCX2449670.1 hypothetical protein [Pedobacter sp. PLR]
MSQSKNASQGTDVLYEENGVVTGNEIRNIQQMWDTAIEMQSNGSYDTETMYAIYKNMNPKLTYQDISNVCSGVFADTYWNNIFMDPSFLAKSLVQALGLDMASANNLAAISIRQWRGILCRKNIRDIGTIPTGTDYTQSVDIVCNQNTELNTDQVIEQWNNQFWQTPQVGKNYIYARCANTNFKGDITNPQLQMFYSTGGFNQPPTSWIQCLTAANGTAVGNVVLQGGEEGSLAPGVRGVSEAFFLNPTSNNHICVIAALTSDFFLKNNPLTIPLGNWNSNTYITSNGASAWHNFDPQKSLEDTLKFYNQDDTEEDFTFVARCKNVPPGSKISLASDDSALKFTTGEIIVTSSVQEIRKTVSLPGNYKGNLKVRFEGPDGKLLPASSALEITQVWNLKHGHTNYLDAVKRLGAIENLRSLAEVQLSLGSFTITGGARAK